MKTSLLVNPAPGFGECRAIDRWRQAERLVVSDIEFRFLDLDGDEDPSIPDVGVRSGPLSTAPATDESRLLPQVVRGTWRAVRDDAGGVMPPREKRVAFLSIFLKAAGLANDGRTPQEILQEIHTLGNLGRDVERRTREAKLSVGGRPMIRKDILWRGEKLRLAHLTVASEFETREAFNEMPGIDLLIAHDARDRPARTAIMAKKTLDLTSLLEAVHDRLLLLEENAWEFVRAPRIGPSPMILPARRLKTESRLGKNPNALFDLIQECVAG